MRRTPWILPLLSLLALLALLALPACSPSSSAQTSAAADPASPAGHVDLRIHYAGHPGSAREKDFVSFLKAHFTAVETSDLAQFDGSQARDADVVIFDYDGDGFKAPQPKVGRDYSRATVTVSVAGGMFANRMGLKTGYL